MQKLDLDYINDAFRRHEKVAFHFSGGRDSTAALYAMHDYWDRMAVYHVDTCDQFPETAAVVDEVERDIGKLIRIKSDVNEVRQQFGMPSDIVPVDNQDGLGRAVSGRELRLIPRYECCARTLMVPMHQRMTADGITLIVRGQRDSEFTNPLARSGYRDGNYELMFPIQEWTDQEVMSYLKGNELPLAPYYDAGMRQAPECIGCTAWWGEGRLKYLSEHHPLEHMRAAGWMRQVKEEIDRQYKSMESTYFEV